MKSYDDNQLLLIEDLELLLIDAKLGEFGDFTSEKYTFPKIALADKLYELRQNVTNGKYDNRATSEQSLELLNELLNEE